MSGVIAFSSEPQDIWLKAGWAFRQVLDDVSTQHPDDSEMAEEFESAKALSGLHIDMLDPDLATRVTKAIRSVVEGILSGTIRSGIHDKIYGDARTIAQYKEALRELLNMLPAPAERDPSGAKQS
jgi:hypothetical protein